MDLVPSVMDLVPRECPKGRGRVYALSSYAKCLFFKPQNSTKTHIEMLDLQELDWAGSGVVKNSEQEISNSHSFRRLCCD